MLDSFRCLIRSIVFVSFVSNVHRSSWYSCSSSSSSCILVLGFIIQHDRIHYTSCYTSWKRLKAESHNSGGGGGGGSSSSSGIFPDNPSQGDTIEKKNRYQFGDFTKNLIGTATSAVNDRTGKDRYEFGDLSRYLDQKAKSRILSARHPTDNEGKTLSSNSSSSLYNYRFGDITLWLDQLVKEKAAQYSTGNSSATSADYSIGDVSRTVVQKIQTGEYDANDIFLILRTLLAAGIAITPITSALPMTVLVHLLNFGLKEQISHRALEAIASALDERLSSALVPNTTSNTKMGSIGRVAAVTAASTTKVLLGDNTKQHLERVIQKFTGSTNEKYQVGDVTKAILKFNMQNEQQNQQQQQSTTKSTTNKLFQLTPKLFEQVSTWDRKFVQQKQLELH